MFEWIKSIIRVLLPEEAYTDFYIVFQGPGDIPIIDIKGISLKIVDRASWTKFKGLKFFCASRQKHILTHPNTMQELSMLARVSLLLHIECQLKKSWERFTFSNFWVVRSLG